MSKDFNAVVAEASTSRTKEQKVEELIQLVVFELDNEEYAVPIEDLREIIRIPEIAPVPNAPDFIRGILNLRGTIVVVVDLEKRFNLVREGKAPASHIIITEVSDSTFGLIVDKVSEVLRIPVSKIQPTPSLVSSKIHAEYLKGVGVLEEINEVETKEKEKDSAKIGAGEKSRLIIILDLPKMLAEEELLHVGNLIDGSVNEPKKVVKKKEVKEVEEVKGIEGIEEVK